jgi:hypothetical protein
LEDNSLIEDENFRFTELMVGDFVKVQGIDDGGANVRALSIVREDASEGDADVRLEGPVTGFDMATPPTLEILGQSVPLNMGTLYFDDLGVLRTEEQFFRDPGDVMLGDVVSAEDFEALSLSTLTEADEVSTDDPS